MYYFSLIICLVFIHSIFAQTYTCDTTASCGCSQSSTSVTARIIGGELAADGAWGWAVALRVSGRAFCTASLLSNEYAVTAAHCVQNVAASSLSILAGTNYLSDTSSNAQTRQITTVFIHPNYNAEQHSYDIALLRFSPFVTNSTNIKYICLPSQNVDPYSDGSNVVAAGWGTTVSGVSTMSQYLRQVTVQIISSTSTQCRNSQIYDTSVQFCAGVNGGGKGKFERQKQKEFILENNPCHLDTCQGDSGGPLMSFVNNRWVLAGITSYGIGCARANYPGIYTRVSTFVTFITSVMQNNAIVSVATTTTTTAAAQAAANANSGSIGVRQYSQNIFLYLIVSFIFYFLF